MLVAILALAPCVSFAATLYWPVTEAQLAGQTLDIPLLDKERNVIAKVPRQQLRTLLSVKEKIASAAGQYGVVLAVSNDDTANAFAGRTNGQATVIFTIPMLQRLADDEQLVAAIMAHEFGHLVHNHTGRAERQAATSAISIIAGIAAGLFIPGPLASTLAANAVDLTSRAMIHSFDRDQEREADAFGVDVMAKAGYDPQAVLRVWSSGGDMNAAGGLFSTHPATDERLANVRQIIAARGPPATPTRTEVAAVNIAPPPSASPALAATRTADPTPPEPAGAQSNTGPATASVHAASIEQDLAVGSRRVDVAAEAPGQRSTSGNPPVIGLVTLRSDAAREAHTYANGGLTPVRDQEGLWGYKDVSGKWVITPTFRHAKPFDNDGLAAVAVGPEGDPRWGFINTSGGWEISARFEDAETFGKERAGYAKVRIGSAAFGQTKYVSRSGELLDRLP